MNRLSQLYHKTARLFGSAKFAVLIILVFAVALIYGTFMESYHGAEYAGRLVYKSVPFMALQALMFMSVLTATLQRLPLKKGLYGFYVLHLGLLIIFIGSFVTYVAGIDGQLTLAPRSPSKRVSLGQDVLIIQKMMKNQEVTVNLPYIAKGKDLDLKIDDITINRYYPFAEKEMQWLEGQGQQQSSSIQFLLANNMMSEEITLSLHPKSDFQSSASLGPLSVHLLPSGLAPCFGGSSIDEEETPAPVAASPFIVWDLSKNKCYRAKNQEVDRKKTPNQREFFGITIANLPPLAFLPAMSPLPVGLSEKGELRILEESPYRLFNQELFTEGRHLFLVGDSAAFDDGDTWQVKKLTKQSSVETPWMGFQVKLKEYSESRYPSRYPVSRVPIQDGGEVVLGNLKTVEVTYKTPDGRTKSQWIESGDTQNIVTNKDQIKVLLTKDSIELPFEVTLNKFHMDYDPGTRNPASYESYVQVFDGKTTDKHRIFMNNPMKKDGLTFYQASYFPLEGGGHGSVLSVNYDPGRPLKYWGSLLLVLGSLWHFVIRRHLVKLKPAKAK